METGGRHCTGSRTLQVQNELHGKFSSSASPEALTESHKTLSLEHEQFAKNIVLGNTKFHERFQKCVPLSRLEAVKSYSYIHRLLLRDPFCIIPSTVPMPVKRFFLSLFLSFFLSFTVLQPRLYSHAEQ
jgi:hypothetical protein